MRTRYTPQLLLVIFVTVAGTLHAKPPPWLVALANKPAAMAYGDANHAVLLDELVLNVDKSGIITEHARYAIRILTHDGRDAATAVLPYTMNSDKVQSFQGWLIPSAGTPIDYGKKQTVDSAVYGNARELYGEARQLTLTAYSDSTPGAVFGFESVVVRKSIYGQQLWSFQQKVPVEYSGITLNLPEGWSADAHTFNHAPISPIATGTSQTWELRALAGKIPEPLAPAEHATLPWLALDLHPPAGAKAIQRLTFPSWSGLSSYFSPLYETAAILDAATKTRADQLVAGATTTWDRIARLCRFAQSVNYISINLNSAQAGGMIPRPASRVLQCNYGDCKDKTTLLLSLLRAQGIGAYPVIVYSGDPTHVHPEWVSSMQFNHCIIAIKVEETVDVPALLVHPTLGRLVVFDPTDDSTPLGWLPRVDADGLGLVLAGAQGELVHLPALRPEENRFERAVTAQLAGDGSIRGTMTERFYGNSSSLVRDEHKAVSETDYRTSVIERWLGHSLPSARVSRAVVDDDFAAAKFSVEVDFESGSYGKTMRSTLLVFKPVLIARRDNTVLKKAKRTQSIVITPTSFTEHADISLPEGFAVDESFPATELTSPFGHYAAHAELRGHQLHFQRTLELHAATLPPEDYDVARGFFEKILQAEQSPVVLKRL